MDREYTFHSEVHQSSGQIDLIWGLKELTLIVKRIEILPRMLLDHNSIILELKGKRSTTFRWRLNEELLDNQNIQEKAGKILKGYFELNLNQKTYLRIV